MTKFSQLLSKLRDSRNLAEAELNELKGKIDAISKLIETLEELERDAPAELLDRVLDTLNPQFHAGRDISISRESSSPSEIVQAAKEVLRKNRRPMRRRELLLELENMGLRIGGQDKSKNLGTILWRHQKEFVNLGGRGYWLVSEELPGTLELPLRND
jgi:hypothetical protein